MVTLILGYIAFRYYRRYRARKAAWAAADAKRLELQQTAPKVEVEQPPLDPALLEVQEKASKFFEELGFQDAVDSQHGAPWPSAEKAAEIGRGNEADPGAAWNFPSAALILAGELDADKKLRRAVSEADAPSNAPAGIHPEHVLFFPPQLEPYGAITAIANTELVPLYPENIFGRPICYFEVTLLRVAYKANVSVGLVCDPYPDFRLPGQHHFSVGFRTSDGRLAVCGSGWDKKWANPVREGNTIGVGILLDVKGLPLGIFFTINGVFIPTSGFSTCYQPHEAVILTTDAQKVAMLSRGWRAAVGSDGEASVAVNFGESKFAWPGAMPKWKF